MRKFRVLGCTGRLLQVTLLAIVLLTSQPLFAMTFTVDTQTDAVDAAPGDGVCATAGGNCSLRAAVQEANAWPGPDVIRVPPGTYVLTVLGHNEDNAATGDLDIRDDLTINGSSDDPASPDATIVDGDQSDRIFDIVTPGAKVVITDLVVRNGQIGSQNTTPIGAGIKNVGDLTISDLLLTNNTNSSSGGGGIANEEGSVVMEYTNVTGNRGSSYGGVQLTFGSMVIGHSRITDNNGGSGGGVGIIGGDMTISDSDISNNTGAAQQGGNGGGISNNGNLTLVRSLVSGNTGAQGGGIANGGTGAITVINSTIDGNKSQSGGGIFNQSTTGSPSAIIISSTISHNNAGGAPNIHQGFGGGIFYTKGITTLMNSIVADNSSPQSTGVDTGPDCSDGTADTANTYPGGQIVSEGYNLDTSGTCLVNDPSAHQSNVIIRGPGDKPDTPAGFAAAGLVYNGGFTQSLDLASGSAALDAVPTGNCTDQDGQPLDKDQRGFTRPVNGACDMGAVEATQTGGTSADLSVHATVSPSPVEPNGTLTYAVTIYNTGPDDATGVTLSDDLPANASFDSADSDPGCSLTSTNSGVQTITCTVGTVLVRKDSGNSDNSVTVVIAAKLPPSATGTQTNKVTVTNSNETDPNTGNNTDSTDVQVNLTADLQATMAATPNPAILNQDNVTYTIDVKNASGASVPGVTLIVNLPSNATLVNNSTSTDRGSCTENAGGKLVTCQLNSMSPGDTAQIKTTVKPTVKGQIVTVATVNFSGTDSDPSNNQASATTDIKVLADVGVSITDNPDPVQVRNDLQYILNVTNQGPSPSSDVTLTATLPANVTFDSVSSSRGNSNCQQSGVTVTCDLKGMLKDAQATVTIFVTPTVVGPLQASATVAIPADETDSNPNNNSAQENTTVVASDPNQAQTDLAMGLTSDPNPVAAGDTLTYTLKVTNNGPEDAGSVIAVLNLPASVKVTAPSTGCTKDASTNIVRCLMGTVKAGGTGQATVGVAPSQAGVLTVTAVVNFVGKDTDQSNNTATTATTVTTNGSSGTGGGGGKGALGTATVLMLLLLCAGGLRRRRTRA